MSERFPYRECAERLKALGDPERLRIVQQLRVEPMNVSELTAVLHSELANVSHHLGVLRHAGIVQTEKQGRYVVYSLHPEVVAATDAKDPHIDLGCCRLELPQPDHEAQ